MVIMMEVVIIAINNKIIIRRIIIIMLLSCSNSNYNKASKGRRPERTSRHNMCSRMRTTPRQGLPEADTALVDISTQYIPYRST